MNVFSPPVQASIIASRMDVMFYSLLALSAVVVLGVLIAIVFFAVRYRRGSMTSRETATHPMRWELAWTLIPLGLFLALFVWSARLYFTLYSPPDDAIPIYVIGKQWMWHVQHVGGQREINQLHIPQGQPVKLIMISQDVIHSFFIPAFRIKQDVLPGRYTTLWFQATRTGDYALHCAEYCGTDHARMGGQVIVMKPAQYRAWLQSHPAFGGLARQGEKLFREYGCSGCHGPNSTVRAPPLEGVFGRPVQLEGGAAVTADETYVRDSILTPRKQVVAGYAPIMPTFEGQVSEQDLLALIAYVKSIGAEAIHP